MKSLISAKSTFHAPGCLSFSENTTVTVFFRIFREPLASIAKSSNGKSTTLRGITAVSICLLAFVACALKIQ